LYRYLFLFWGGTVLHHFHLVLMVLELVVLAILTSKNVLISVVQNTLMGLVEKSDLSIVEYVMSNIGIE
jgi:hypothetical protein